MYGELLLVCAVGIHGPDILFSTCVCSIENFPFGRPRNAIVAVILTRGYLDCFCKTLVRICRPDAGELVRLYGDNGSRLGCDAKSSIISKVICNLACFTRGMIEVPELVWAKGCFHGIDNQTVPVFQPRHSTNTKPLALGDWQLC